MRRRDRVACAGALLLLLGGCARREAEKAVVDLLEVPTSAMFRNEVRIGNYICGEVDSIDGYGGKIGWRSFDYDVETGNAEVQPDPMDEATPKERADYKVFHDTVCPARGPASTPPRHGL